MAGSITDVAVGHTFDSVEIQVSAERVRAYLSAVGDTQIIYESMELVPPLAAVAFALGNLLESVSLPPGSLHASESAEFLAPIGIGDSVECHARLAQRSQRSGWLVSVLETEISVDGRTAALAKATVMSPLDES